jgi:hypothetical protein
MTPRAILVLSLAVACERAPAPPPAPAKPKETAEPARVVVDRILIAFEGNAQGLESHRPREEARALAYSLLQRIRGGADFAVLKAEFSDDPAKRTGLPYVICNYRVQHRLRKDGIPEIPRGALFGDLPFTLAPGDVAVLDYEPGIAHAGWEIVKRLR